MADTSWEMHNFPTPMYMLCISLHLVKTSLHFVSSGNLIIDFCIRIPKLAREQLTSSARHLLLTVRFVALTLFRGVSEHPIRGLVGGWVMQFCITLYFSTTARVRIVKLGDSMH